MPSTIGLREQTAEASGDGLGLEAGTCISRDAEGNLTLPAALLAGLGLAPADEIILERIGHRLVLASDTLRRVYVEATSLCNLSCASCIRNAWHLLTESRRSAGRAAFDGEGIPSRRHFSRGVIRAIANGLGCVVTAESARAREVLPLEGRKGNRGHPHAAPVIGAGPTASF